jgi:hypothetical protein
VAAWDTTPLNYLEKIFNIPFVLPGMNSRNFANLISGWSAGTAAGLDEPTVVPRSIELADGDAGAEKPLTMPDASAVAPREETVDLEPVGPSIAVRVAAEGPVEVGSDVDLINRGSRPKPRPLSPPEVDHLRALAPLVQTPREAKRVFNLYRTLRCRGNLSPASVFLGDEQTPGDFQAVIVLLGLLTAEPRLVGDLLWSPPDTRAGVTGGICHRSSSTTWLELLDGLEPRQSGSAGWFNDLGKLGQQPGSWEQVLPKLKQASALVTLPDLTAFQRWGPLVARFSFILSPLAAGVVDGATASAATHPAGQATMRETPAEPNRSN